MMPGVILLRETTRLDEAYATLTPAPHSARTDIAGAWRPAWAGLSSSRGSGAPVDAGHDLPDRARNAVADRQPGCHRRAAAAIALRAVARNRHGCLSAAGRCCRARPEPWSGNRACNCTRRLGAAVERHGGGGTHALARRRGAARGDGVVHGAGA